MRVTGLVLILSMAAGPALAQPQNVAPTGRPPATAAKKKSDVGADMSANERALLQLDLAWTGDYNGLITGAPGERTTAAVKSFQKGHGLKETGSLGPPERAQLATASKQIQEEVGWRMVEDRATGARIGLPTKQVSQTAAGKSGTRWFSAQGQIQIETFRIRDPGMTLADVLDQQEKEPPGRQIELNVLRGDFFVLSGRQGLKKFYVRAEIREGEVRGMTILYDQATEGIMDPVVVVMSSAFAPFSGSGIATLIAPPGRRKVEYGSGIVVSSTGDILSDRSLTSDCSLITIAGYGNVGRLAEDDALVLLRIHGSTDLVPLPLAAEDSAGELMLVGIADPQAQGGGNAVSTVAARRNGDSIVPPPPLGFGGAAAIDNQGRLVGMVRMKSAAVADAAGTAAPAPAALVPAAALRRFLDAKNVALATDSSGADAAKAAMVRVICVRD